jgi:methylenetetrahydrofolate dehydrogenase (NADP+)/methenyltetrahydrofolate cyclohydrolase
MVRDDAVIIDVGTTREEDGTVHGDANTLAFMETDCWVTPVPGGVGPMTIALLMRNLFECAQAQTKNN